MGEIINTNKLSHKESVRSVHGIKELQLKSTWVKIYLLLVLNIWRKTCQQYLLATSQYSSMQLKKIKIYVRKCTGLRSECRRPPQKLVSFSNSLASLLQRNFCMCYRDALSKVNSPSVSHLERCKK